MDKTIEIIANIAGVGSFLLTITLLFIRKELQENNKSIIKLTKTIIKNQQIISLGTTLIGDKFDNVNVLNYDIGSKKKYNKKSI